jgi:hypothetical protein
MVSAVAKVGKVAAGTAANLAQGTWDVAKAKAGEMKDAAMDRISETTGGKIAAAIKARAIRSPYSAATAWQRQTTNRWTLNRKSPHSVTAPPDLLERSIPDEKQLRSRSVRPGDRSRNRGTRRRP